MLTKLFLSFSVFFLFACDNEDLVKHYVDLIQNESARAYTIELPTSAASYISRSDEVLDCGIFDHIVIGAGSAGAVVAKRLSEDNSRQVLLLEAGDDGSEFSSIPGSMVFSHGLEHNWNYYTVPQNNACLGLVGKQCRYPRGKGLGGSSLINALMYARGNKQDYDDWFKLGNVGWSFEDILPYFKKSEKFLNGFPKYQGADGNLNVELIEPTSLQAKAFFDANNQLGHKLIQFNTNEGVGYGKVYLNTYKGLRQSTGTSFLKPIKNKVNLQILKNTFVTKVSIDDKNRAYGVEFSGNGRKCKAQSKQDIVLSAGSIGSPQILMLSGIGPKHHLEALGIPVIKDLNVGKALMDHPMMTNLEFTTNYTEITPDLEQYARELINNGKGILANPLNVQAVAFLKTNASKILDKPDIEVIMMPAPLNYDAMSTFFNYNKETYKAMTTDGNTLQNFFMFVVALHPKSVGTLELTSKAWYDYPNIDPKFLSDSNGHDINILYEGTKLILKLIETPAFQKLNTKLRHIHLPSCAHHEYLSKDYWYCRIKYFANSVYHPVGTCKMGTDPSLDAVVDSQLRVYGIENLRVADASVIPSLISGHTNSPSIMIGQRVADFILNDEKK